MKTQADLYEAAAKVLRMIEGTNVTLAECVKLTGVSFDKCVKTIAFDCSPLSYQFAIAIVEGKPVFAGDELYDGYGRLVKAEEAEKFSDTSYLSLKTDGRWYAITDYSWNPPKSKTVMVELLREDAEFVASGSCYFCDERGKRLQKSIQKALES